MVEDVEGRTHGNQWAEESQSEPDDEGIVLLTEGLAGLRAVMASAQESAKGEVDDTDQQRKQGDLDQRGDRGRNLIADKIGSLGTLQEQVDQPEGERKGFAFTDHGLCITRQMHNQASQQERDEHHHQDGA